MKKVYCSGKFNKSENKNHDLATRLCDDYRAILLGNSARLVNAANDVKINNKYLYAGPFYCEQASNGNFTSTDCNTVVAAEYTAVNNADIFIAVFDEFYSPGTVTELGWAITAGKQIYILYQPQDSKYTIKSENWFPITDAITRSDSVRVYSYNDKNEMIKIIQHEILK